MASPPSRLLGTSEDNWARATASGTGIQAFGSAHKRHLDLNLVTLAAREVIDSHCFLRTQIVENSKGKLCYQVRTGQVAPIVETRQWPAATAGGLDGILLLPHDDSDHHLSRVLNHVLIEEINTPFPLPNKQNGVDVFVVHVYSEPARSRTIVMVRLHSGAFDRASALIISQSMLSSLNAVIAGKKPQLQRLPGKDELLPTLEDSLPKGTVSKGFFQKGFDAVGYVVGSGKYSLLPFNPEFTGEKSGFHTDIVCHRFGKSGTASLVVACKQEGTSVTSALAAAFLKTVADLKELKSKQKDAFSLTGVVNSRPYLDSPIQKLVLGNYTAGFPLPQQVKQGTSFWDVARNFSSTVEKSLSKSLQFSELPVLNMLFNTVLKRPNLTPSSSMRTALFTTFVDGPLNLHWKDLENLHLAGTFGPYSSMHGVGPCFFLGETYLEKQDLLLTIVYPKPVHTRAQMDSLLASSVQLLSEVVKST